MTTYLLILACVVGTVLTVGTFFLAGWFVLIFLDERDMAKTRKSSQKKAS